MTARMSGASVVRFTIRLAYLPELGEYKFEIA